jgi:threonine/homoserine/homoserine lactone efflux protein
MWAGFVAGIAAILGNPKAVLFYMGVLPGFFDLRIITWIDVAIIIAVSVAVPLVGNLATAAFIGQMRGLIGSPESLRRINVGSGILLILVGIVIAVL